MKKIYILALHGSNATQLSSEILYPFPGIGPTLNRTKIIPYIKVYHTKTSHNHHQLNHLKSTPHTLNHGTPPPLPLPPPPLSCPFPQTSAGNTVTQSFAIILPQSNHHKQEFSITTNKMSHISTKLKLVPCAPACDCKFLALAVYLHPTFTRPF